VLRAAGETETTQENIKVWINLDEGVPWSSASDRGRNCCSDIFFFNLFSSALPVLLNFSFICFLSFFYLLGLSFASLIRIIESLL
jgi:hypothetical protein